MQSRVVDTASVASVPADGAVPESVLETETLQRDAVGDVIAMLDDVPPHESAKSASTHAGNSRARIARCSVQAGCLTVELGNG